MNCLPVIEMEMRSASRRTWTFKLRLLFALAGAAACLVVLILPNLAPAVKGRTMLVILSFLSLAFCLVAGGFLTADCVSSEKREGTLGLLFLTPLTGLDIVLGKMICHGLQTFYGVCALFPVFFLPLLTGGVTWAEVSRILLALGLALVLSASIGMVVSVLGTESRRTILTTFACVVLMAAVPMLYLMVQTVFLRHPAGVLPQLSPVFTVMSGFDSSYRLSKGPAVFWGSLAALAFLSVILVVGSGLLVGRVFKAMGTSGTAPRKRRPSHVPGDVLEQNPYEWLVLRSACEARAFGVLTQFSILFFCAVLVLSLTTGYWQEAFSAAFFTALGIHWIAKLHFAVEATRQINTDHQSRAIELLMVAPLQEGSILEGHHRALGRISRKPLVVLIGLNLALELCVILAPGQLHMERDVQTAFSTLFIGGMALAAADFRSLRWLAILKGLRASTHVRAVLLAFSSAMILPWIGVGLVIALLAGARPRELPVAGIFFVWVTLSLTYDWLLVRRCRGALQGGLRHLASEGC